MVGLGATPVCGMAGRGVSIAFDDPGASSAGSGDWAFAGDVGSAAMLAANIRDTIRMRNMGFPIWPLRTTATMASLFRHPVDLGVVKGPPARRGEMAAAT
jgi:hypothetical protein